MGVGMNGFLRSLLVVAVVVPGYVALAVYVPAVRIAAVCADHFLLMKVQPR